LHSKAPSLDFLIPSSNIEPEISKAPREKEKSKSRSSHKFEIYHRHLYLMQFNHKHITFVPPEDGRSARVYINFPTDLQVDEKTM
jgi:hypothetical protein